MRILEERRESSDDQKDRFGTRNYADNRAESQLGVFALDKQWKRKLKKWKLTRHSFGK